MIWRKLFFSNLLMKSFLQGSAEKQLVGYSVKLFMICVYYHMRLFMIFLFTNLLTTSSFYIINHTFLRILTYKILCQHIHSFHVYIQHQIALSNEIINQLLMCIVGIKNWKIISWSTFVQGDIINISPKSYLWKQMGGSHIICEFELNAYLHDLPHDMNTSPIFNVKDAWNY